MQQLSYDTDNPFAEDVEIVVRGEKKVLFSKVK